MEYKFDKKVNTKNFEINIGNPENYGYFEHHEYGDECGGGLWFDENKELIDYDGVAVLPREVGEALRAEGFIVGEDCF